MTEAQVSDAGFYLMFVSISVLVVGFIFAAFFRPKLIIRLFCGRITLDDGALGPRRMMTRRLAMIAQRPGKSRLRLASHSGGNLFMVDVNRAEAEALRAVLDDAIPRLT